MSEPEIIHEWRNTGGPWCGVDASGKAWWKKGKRYKQWYPAHQIPAYREIAKLALRVRELETEMSYEQGIARTYESYE